MTQPSLMEALTGIKTESSKEISEHIIASEWECARRIVWQVMILSAWFVFIAAGIALAFGYPTLGLAVTALVATIMLGAIGSGKQVAKGS